MTYSGVAYSDAKKNFTPIRQSVVANRPQLLATLFLIKIIGAHPLYSSPPRSLCHMVTYSLK